MAQGAAPAAVLSFRSSNSSVGQIALRVMQVSNANMGSSARKLLTSIDRCDNPLAAARYGPAHCHCIPAAATQLLLGSAGASLWPVATRKWQSARRSSGCPAKPNTCVAAGMSPFGQSGNDRSWRLGAIARRFVQTANPGLIIVPPRGLCRS